MRYLAAPAAVAALVALFGAVSSASVKRPSDVSLDNPLQLVGALQMAVLFQLVLMIVHVARQWWGASGLLTSAAVLGLTDVDALTVSMTRGVANTVSPTMAATAVAIGVLANTGMKLGLALFFGSRGYRLIAGGALALMFLALAAALAVSHLY